MRQIRTVELIPGRLSARILVGTTPGGREVWLYASDGLQRLGQRELVLQVLRERRDAEDGSTVPNYPLALMTLAHQEASAGRPFEAGKRVPAAGVAANEPGVTGYLFEEHPDGASLYPDGLPPILAVPLIDDEYQVADMFGHARLLALLGEQARVFPYPAYFTRRRRAVLDFRKHSAATKLNLMPMTHTPWIEVASNQTELRVTVTPDRADWLAWLLREHAPRGIALLTAATHSVAPQRFYWTRDGIRSAINITGTRPTPDTLTAGNFLMLVVAEGASSTNHLEDGFGLVLSPADRDAIAEALTRGHEFRRRLGHTEVVVGTGAIGHASPFGAYIATDTFRRHEPETAAPAPPAPHPDMAATQRIPARQPTPDPPTKRLWPRSDRTAKQQAPDLPPPPPLWHPDAPARLGASPDSRPYWQDSNPPHAATGDAATQRLTPPAPVNGTPLPQAVQRTQVVLLAEEAAFAAELSVEELTAFCDEMSRIVDEAVAGAPYHDLEQLVVGVEFAPERPLRVSLATKGSFPKPAAQALVNRLDAMTPPRVRERVLSFELWFAALG
ncbi:hypothetical protein JK358_20355 [Nocardia sp. 2]|uniref:Uncharacterized protein n=1 Tax=Nocardia acididurans TaxID=2802282 RepID=A0ABS1M7Z1_9NOCA|nr:hypothetical protein [Nocardia acididurans]MBL1076753.1 hypothetical protein [Nocardia acididurans]